MATTAELEPSTDVVGLHRERPPTTAAVATTLGSKRQRRATPPLGTATPEIHSDRLTNPMVTGADGGEHGHQEAANPPGSGPHAAVAASEAVGVADPSPAPEPVKRKRGRRRLIHDEELRKTRRKMQCKLNQRRYRARQRGMITTLSLDNEKINDHIQELEAYRQFLSAFYRGGEDLAMEEEEVDTSHCRQLLIVQQFFEIFRHGFALHSVETSEIQEEFIRFAMDPTLHSQGATTRGIEALLLQLKRYTSYHAVFVLEMESCQVISRCSASPPIVEVTGRLQLRLSRDTVMLLYPHIIENDALNTRVVGHEIEPGFRMIFQFNDRCKVSRFDFAVDFVAAFLRLLGNVTDTVTLLERAMITPFSELGVDPHGDADANPKDCKQLSLQFILL